MIAKEFDRGSVGAREGGGVESAVHVQYYIIRFMIVKQLFIGMLVLTTEYGRRLRH